MASVPTPKKSWVYDGAIAQYPEDFLSSYHGSNRSCVDCHSGDDTASTRALAHAGGFVPIPDSTACLPCHTPIADMNEGSLHVHLGGYVAALTDRGVNLSMGSTARERYDAKCTECHVANDAETEARCGHCHVSVPRVAGHGFLNGHNWRKTPDMDRNCTACHGSRIKAEFQGLNGDLIARNGLGLAAPLPDVHYASTQELNADGLPYGCTFCHTGDEIHGAGAPAPGAGTRYDVTSGPTCTGCHTSVVDSNSLHTSTHLGEMTCYVCHAQPYKQCFGCHLDLDVGGTGLPFFTVNAGDPTLASRPAGSAPDALMSFRIGRSPLPGKLNPLTGMPYGYTLLRHVPIDADLFRYPTADEVLGLVPNVPGLPTWTFATPHSIRALPGASGTVHLDPTACSSCHGGTFADYWLTDPLVDDEGWLEAPYEPDETAANAGVVQPGPVPMGP